MNKHTGFQEVWNYFSDRGTADVIPTAAESEEAYNVALDVLDEVEAFIQKRLAETAQPRAASRPRAHTRRELR